MVATIGGAGLGLFNTSAATLGQGGVLGNPSTGRRNEQVYVNGATGNLVIQDTDERVASTGLDLTLLRTYNSQGTVDGDNNDNWQIGVYQAVLLSGFWNAPGSTATKIFGDGAQVVYTYDGARNLYTSTDGDGAHDTLSYADGYWTWTDGTTRATEVYSDLSGLMVSARDADGNTTTYNYNLFGLLTSVVDPSGQTTYLDYTGSYLTQVRVVSQGQTQTLTRYDYDGGGRLWHVTVDLTPQDNSVSDNQTYVTTYTYSGESDLVASITQKDGSSVAFSYQTLNGQARVSTVTVTSAAGVTRLTRYAYGTYNSAGGYYNQVDVTDALNLVTTYTFGTGGRLASVLSPTVGGARVQTNYGYDGSGNLTTIVEDPAGLNRTTTHTYSPQGNLEFTRDAAGNTITRTYNGANQLVTETRYLAPDPDGTGSAQAGTPITARFVYDAEHHLRFTVSADGRVTEHRYNAVGLRVLTLVSNNASYPVSGLSPTAVLTESQVATWAAGQDQTRLQRTDYAYDFRGQLSSTTAWSATTSTGAGSGTPSITRYVYDARGNLLQRIEARGEATTTDATDFRTVFTYDGLGRLLTTTEWLASGRTRVTSTSYDDSGSRTVTTFANGLVATSTYNLAGELTSVLNTGAAGANLGTTQYRYDADGQLRVTLDPTGVRQYMLYDDAGRKIADVDGDGSLTEYIYDGANQPIKSIRYAVLVPATTLATLADAQGTPSTTAQATLLTTLRTAASGNAAADKITRNVYNRAGQLVFTFDEAGAVTEMRYDGAGRLTDTIAYATPVAIARTVNQVLPGGFTVTTHADDRRTRYFYDNDGHRTGTLDAEGYLSENRYNPAGQLIQTVAYSAPTPVAQRAAGTFLQLKPTGIDIGELDTYFFYDGQGRRNGVLDAEGYLTEISYDAAGHITQSRRYDTKLSFAPGATVDSLRPTGGTSRASTFQYDGAGRLTLETDPEGTSTFYIYDGADRVLSRTVAVATTEARTRQTRYDALGRVLQTLDGEGSLQITTGMTQAQVDAVWDRYGTRYAYDAAGRQISKTVTAFDAGTGVTQVLTTRYYYDADGRTRFTINPAGEVSEQTYDAFGQLATSRGYSNRIATTGLTGGLLSGTLPTQLTPIADALHDSRQTFAYTLTGKLQSVVDLVNAGITHHYNAFGEEDYRLDKVDATRTRRTDYTYDHRGLLTATRADSTGLNLREGRGYDAFGRITSVTDAAGNVSRIEYDKLGRAVATVDELGQRRGTTYDVFDRVLTTTDALGAVTRYAYSDIARSVTVTTPEGIVVQTVHNRHGQTFSVTAAGNTTNYVYNGDGQLKTVSDGLGALESRGYDSAGRQVTETDGKGAITRFGYDAASRVLTRTVDTAGLALATVYQFDGQGRTTQVTEPNGRVTRTDYDTAGRITSVVVDPAGLALTTRYTYDLENRVLTVVENAGTGAARRLQYLYDAAGRRTEEILDPVALGGTLNLRTQYRYDADSNLTRKIDSAGNSTWYVYDARGRLTYTIEAMGQLHRDVYDAEDRVVGTRDYFTPVTTTGFGDVVTLATANAAVRTHAQDQFNQTVYDRDGRAVFSIDALNGVIERRFDDAGRIVYARSHARAIAAGTYSTVASVQVAIIAAGNQVNGQFSADDRLAWTAYDLRGRVAYAQDGMGGVTGYSYDGNGNVMAKTVYAAVRDRSLGTTKAAFDSWANNADANNHVTRYWYDGADRARFTLDGEGYLSETRYTDSAREQREITYMAPRSIAAGATLATVAASATIGSTDQVVLNRYDAALRLASVTDGENNTESYVYDLANHQVRTTNGNGGVRVDTYDAVGRLRTSLSPGGILLTKAYDALGNVTSSTVSKADGSDARTTGYLYDVMGRQTRITDAEGFATSIEYDVFGNQTRITTGQYLLVSGQPGFDVNKAARATVPLDTRYAYDALNRLSDMTDGDGDITHYAYNDTGERKSVTEAFNQRDGTLARTTSYQYDNAGRLFRVTSPLGGRTEYLYDTAGNKKQERVLQRANLDASGKVVLDASGNPVNPVWSTRTFEYYKNERLRAEVDPYGTRNETYYDAAGNVTELRSAAGTSDQRSVSMRYDRVNRLTAQLDGYGRATTYAYDKVGNRTKVTMPADAQGRVAIARYYFDADNRIITVLDPDGVVNTFKYDTGGNQTEVRVYANRYTGTISDTTAPTPTASAANDRISVQVFDRTDRLTSITQPDGTRTDYINNASGQKISERQYANVTGGSRQMLYTYDRDGRLQDFLDVDGTRTSFTYDAAGNRKSETITAATSYSDPNATRRTEYDYDLNNRRITETFDRTGLNIVRSMAYDLVGNLVSRSVNAVTETGPSAETYAYDLNNRQATVTDGVGNATMKGFDRVGNVTSVTDGRGNTTNYVYDLNNRLTQEIAPSVSTFTIAGGTQTVRPTAVHTYDAVGNEVQTTDPNGNKTTRYYDGSGHVLAKLSGVGGLCVYTYNTAGEVTQQIDYMTRLAATAHNPAVRPAAPGGESRLTSYQRDLAGRVTLVTYPATEITTLTSAATNNPGSTRSTVAVTERHVFNAFGDETESYDRAGNRTLHYYDLKHREVAIVDALGYLKEQDFDAMGNITTQRVYQTAYTSPSTLTAGTRPTPPGGGVDLTNWTYDAASRLTAQVDPLVDVDLVSAETPPYAAANIRRATLYTYDQAGNLRTKTVAAGLPNAQTEVYYYDAANRRIGTLDKNRALTRFFYDASGNLTRQWRIYGTVSSSTLTGPLAMTNIVIALNDAADRNPNADQVKDMAYDAANRLTTETDRMVFRGVQSGSQIVEGNTADDLTKKSAYDAAGNRTKLTDEDNYDTLAAYDADRHVVQTVAADGVRSVVEYDVLGNKVRMYSGLTANGASAATNVTASRVNGKVVVSYAVAAGNTVSWVVYGSESSNTVEGDAYAFDSASQVNGGGTARAELTNAQGGAVYFRVVTTDGVGNLAWTAEQVLSVPSEMTRLYVVESGEGYWVNHINADFSGPVTNVQLLVGNGPNLTDLTQVNAMTQLTDGTGAYQGRMVIDGVSHYAVRWTDNSGAVHTSEVKSIYGGTDQVDLTTTTTRTAVTGGFRLQADVKVAASVYSSAADLKTFTQMQASWKLVGSTAPAGTTAFGGPVLDESFPYSGSIRGGTYTFRMTLGATTPLAAGTYRIEIIGSTGDGRTMVVDSYDLVVGATQPASVTQQTSTWLALPDTPPSGYAELVKWQYGGGLPSTPYRDVQGRFAIETASDGRRVMHVPVMTQERDNYKVIFHYGEPAAFPPATVTVSSSNPSGATTTLTFTITLSPQEAATVDDTSWYPGINSSFFVQIRPVVTDGYLDTTDPWWGDYIQQTGMGVYSVTIPDVSTATDLQYHIQYNVDPANSDDPLIYGATGHIFEDRLNARVATTTKQYSTFVETQQVAWGTIWYHPDLNALDEGYQGRVYFDASVSDLPPVTGDRALTLSGTAAAGPGTRLTNGLAQGYVVEWTYDAVNNLVATNENGGLYTEYGRDANGNIVETRLYGVKNGAYRAQLGRAITSHATYDARNRMTARFDAAVPVSGGGSARPIHRWVYDAYDRITRDTDANANQIDFVYNAWGLVTRQTDFPNPSLNPNGVVTTKRYNVLGQVTQTLIPLGGRTINFYDNQGRLIRSRDANNNDTGYGWDLFDRNITVTDGRGMATAVAGDYTTTYAFDNRNRMVVKWDAEAWHLLNDNSQLYRDERVALGWVADANQLTDKSLVTSGVARMYATIYGYDGRNHQTLQTTHQGLNVGPLPVGQGSRMGHGVRTAYDAMGRITLVEETGPLLSAGGTPAVVSSQRTRYDAYGNVIAEIDGLGRTRSYEYEAFGRLHRKVDEDGVGITYTYDDFGRQDSELGDQLPTPSGGSQPIPRAIVRHYDDGGHLTQIQDIGTGIYTSYTYDLNGNRKTEVVTLNDPLFNIFTGTLRSFTYKYDGFDRMTYWKDSVTGLNENIEYDNDGNRTRIYTDAGSVKAIDHRYTYDAGRRVRTETDSLNSNRVLNAWTYDAANNRATWTDSIGLVTSYTYSDGSTGVTANNRVGTARLTNGSRTELWSYDMSGDVLKYETWTFDANRNLVVTKTRTTYNTGAPSGEFGGLVDVTSVSEKVGSGAETVKSTSVTAHDLSRRTTGRVDYSGNTKLTTTYEYHGDGREKKITTTGAARPALSISEYNGNGERIRIDRDQGDGQSRHETEAMLFDNEGHVINLVRDDGKTTIRGNINYLYANGNPVGQVGNLAGGGNATLLDEGAYSLVKNIGSDHPGAVTSYVVNAGETLQSIAGKLYGNPSLWYVIADANGLSGNEALAAGTLLIVPNTVMTGLIDGGAHTVYNESGIVGSTLPNLLTPPPKKRSVWAYVVAAIITVIIAVVLTVVTYGAGAAGAAALGGAAGAAYLAGVGVVTGLAIAGVALAAQGIAQEIDTGQNSLKAGQVLRALAGGAVSGLFSGLAAGVGNAVNLAAQAGTLSSAVSSWAPVAQGALQMLGASTGQLIANGKISNWSGIALAGVGGYFGGQASIAKGLSRSGNQYAGHQASLAQNLELANDSLGFVSPWAAVAETALRGDRLDAADQGSALAAAVTSSVYSAVNIGIGLAQMMRSKNDAEQQAGGNAKQAETKPPQPERDVIAEAIADGRVRIVQGDEGWLADNGDLMSSPRTYPDGPQSGVSGLQLGYDDLALTQAQKRYLMNEVSELDARIADQVDSLESGQQALDASVDEVNQAASANNERGESISPPPTSTKLPPLMPSDPRGREAFERWLDRVAERAVPKLSLQSDSGLDALLREPPAPQLVIHDIDQFLGIAPKATVAPDAPASNAATRKSEFFEGFWNDTSADMVSTVNVLQIARTQGGVGKGDWNHPRTQKASASPLSEEALRKSVSDNQARSLNNWEVKSDSKASFGRGMNFDWLKFATGPNDFSPFDVSVNANLRLEGLYQSQDNLWNMKEKNGDPGLDRFHADKGKISLVGPSMKLKFSRWLPLLKGAEGQAYVASSMQLMDEARLRLRLGGPLGVQADMAFHVAAEFFPGQVHMDAKSRVFRPLPAPLDFIEFQEIGRLDLNYGIGGSFGVGLLTRGDRPGLSFYLDAGATLGGGARAHVVQNISFNPELMKQRMDGLAPDLPPPGAMVYDFNPGGAGGGYGNWTPMPVGPRPMSELERYGYAIGVQMYRSVKQGIPEYFGEVLSNLLMPMEQTRHGLEQAASWGTLP